MLNRPRSILLVLLVALSSVAVAACGSGSKSGSSASVDQLLQDTFSGKTKITKGKLDLSIRANVSGSKSGNGPFAIRLSGPFESQGAGRLPKFAMDASLEGGGQSFKAGAISTGDKGFIGFQGTEYAVSDNVFRQFKAGYEQAQKQAGQRKGTSLATLGIDPRRWLKDAHKAGEAKVGDADTIRITGNVDVGRLLDDLNSALKKARNLGLQGNQRIPQGITDAQKSQALQAIKHLAVDIYTGKDDHALRRMTVNLAVAQKGESAQVAFDLSLLDLNKDQTIQAPSGAKPMSELLGRLGSLGGVLGGSSSASGSAKSGAVGNANLQKYTRCVAAAGSNAAKARKCADLLTP
jgi:hypothetical protein